MKFTMISRPWDNVIEEVAAAGHEYVDSVDDADFIIYSGGPLPDPLPENVRFIQWVFTGVEQLVGAGVMKPGTRWANAAGVFAKPVAEHAMALILASLHQYKYVFEKSSFSIRREMDSRQDWLFLNKRVAIFGAGGIGRELISMLRPFGPHITAVNRSGRPVEGADETVAMAEADHVWGEADIVVLVTPLTFETIGMVNAEVLDRMKESAYLINVGRGGLVVTDDLVDALSNRRIRGAGLEVVDPEPLPEEHALWHLDNVVLTPHVAALGSVARAMIAPTIIANAAAVERGERMPTEVDVEAGY